MAGGRAARAAALCLVSACPLLGSACGGGDDAIDHGPEPRVDLIEPAVAAIEAERGAAVEFVELSATLEDVRAIVRDDGTSAVAYRYDGELTGPVEPRDDARETFTAEQVDIDPEHVFDGVREELGSPAIVDVAIRVDGGALVVDATVASDAGGVLLVLLDGRGAVLGTQTG